MNLTIRIKNLITEVSKDIFEKEIIFKLAFLAMLSGESIFLLGKPGIAKSMIARRIKFALKDGKIFEYLMNRFSTPDEIFGSISIKSLQEGKYARLTDRYLPTANIAFLDEIWKSGPSILNNLLTILNEKIFRNDGVDVKVPLWLLISASNELPEENKGLEALYDRFIIRYIARPLIKKENFDLMLKANISPNIQIDESIQITQEEYYLWLSRIKDIKVTQVTLEFINIFKKELSVATNNEAYISDRRWTKIIHIMKSSAYYNGRTEIDKTDWFIIPYCIWDSYEQEAEYQKIFSNTLKKNLMIDIEIKKISINRKITFFLSKIRDIETEIFLFEEFINLFNNKINGVFYQIKGFNEEYKFCYIKKTDYLELLNNLNTNIKTRLYLSNDNMDISNIKNFMLRVKESGKIILQNNNKKNNLYIKKNNLDPEVKLNEINAELINLKTIYNELINNSKNEFNRFSNESNIFFNEDLKLFIEDYKNKKNIIDNVMK